MTGVSEPERLAILVHEVRSPVAALAAIAQALRAREFEGSDRHELVALAVAACRGIERIVLDAGLASIDVRPLDAEALVRETVASAALRGGQVEAVVAPALPRVAGDVVRLRQALDNLVENALAWSPPGETVVVGARPAGDGVELFVSDLGPGVPPEERERIFERGTRLDPTRGGSGIGLAVVRAIAEAHGGSVSVDAEDGTGATFRIRLPAS